MKSSVIVAYVPVIHRGYLEFFQNFMEEVDAAFIMGRSLIDEFMPLHREIRGLGPAEVRKLLIGYSGSRGFWILAKSEVKAATQHRRIILPNEEISRKFAAKYLEGGDVCFEDIFLRWDEASVFSQKVVTHDRVSEDEFDRKMMKLAEEEAGKSSDWWRHVGAVAVMGEIVLFADHNQHVPSEHMPYIQGDPRDYIQAGQRSELSTALHGEQVIILRAAREGVSLKGASIYVTTFPCPVCAKLIAYSGISKCFFGSGHASLDGESIMRSQGVEIIQIV